MNAVEQFEAAIADAWPPTTWSETHVVVAISGGADSCALLAALVKLKSPGAGEIIAAHFHHGLRVGAADADESFVRDFCEQLGIRLIVGHGDVASAAALAGAGIEAAARAARYAFLLETAQQQSARYVVTGHTADDQVETILHRILRGTGIAGLAGMSATRPLSETITLVRPLLRLSRVDVLAYLAARGLTYRDDATNADVRYTRNRLRHKLLPRLRADYNADVDAALLRLGRLAGESQSVIDALVGSLIVQAATLANERVVVMAPPLRSQPRYVVRELFIAIWRRCHWPQQSMGLAEWEALADLALTSHGDQEVQRTFPGSIRATKKGEQLTLTRLD